MPADNYTHLDSKKRRSYLAHLSAAGSVRRCRQLFDPIGHELQLAHRLFTPQRAILIERGNPRFGRDVFWAAFLGDIGDERDDRRLGHTIGPGWQRVDLLGVSG